MHVHPLNPPAPGLAFFTTPGVHSRPHLVRGRSWTPHRQLQPRRFQWTGLGCGPRAQPPVSSCARGLTAPTSCPMLCHLNDSPLPPPSTLHRNHHNSKSLLSKEFHLDLQEGRRKPLISTRLVPVSLRGLRNNFRLIISDNSQMFVNFFKGDAAQFCLPLTTQRRLSWCLVADVFSPGESRSLDLLRRADFR